MKFGYVICGVACAGLTLALTAAWPQDAKAKDKAPAGKPAAAGQDAAGKDAAGKGLLVKAMMPGEHHKQLADLRGNWNVSVKSTEDPGAAPVESTGTSVFALVMDGRYVVENFVGKGPMGPFTGMGLYGYNNMANEYENVWVDNMSTGMMKSTGDWDDTMKAFKWHGEFVSPKNGGKTKFQSIMKKLSDTRYEYTMLEERGAKLFKSLELVYTKA